MAEATCLSCIQGCIITDPDTGARVCNRCGLEHGAVEVFVHQHITLLDGAAGAFSSRFYSVSAEDASAIRRDRKIYLATAAISSMADRLGLSAARSADALRLATDATDGELADPTCAFLPALAAACCLLVARQHRLPLALPEAAAAAGCEPRALGHLVNRIAVQLSLPPLPFFDAAAALDRAVHNSPSLSRAAGDKADFILSDAGFLLKCAAKWGLSTGRHTLPLVAAVASFAAEANGVTSVSVNDIARDISASVLTSRGRLRELVGVLVRVSRAVLPWGGDVTPKNLMQNAPLLLQMMRLRSVASPSDGIPKPFELPMVEPPMPPPDADEAEYFAPVEPDKEINTLVDFKISKESLSSAYNNVAMRVQALMDDVEARNKSGSSRTKRQRPTPRAIARVDPIRGGWSDPGKNSGDIDELLNRDVGFDMLPPAFVVSVESRLSRKGKIAAAIDRINTIKKGMPQPADANSLLELSGDVGRPPDAESPAEPSGDSGKRGAGDQGWSSGGRWKSRKRRKDRTMEAEAGVLEWEDCVIELLLLRGVAPAEIEQGQYRRLLDLHVFGY